MSDPPPVDAGRYRIPWLSHTPVLGLHGAGPVLVAEALAAGRAHRRSTDERRRRAACLTAGLPSRSEAGCPDAAVDRPYDVPGQTSMPHAREAVPAIPNPSRGRPSTRQLTGQRLAVRAFLDPWGLNGAPRAASVRVLRAHGRPRSAVDAASNAGRVARAFDRCDQALRRRASSEPAGSTFGRGGWVESGHGRLSFEPLAIYEVDGASI